MCIITIYYLYIHIAGSYVEFVPRPGPSRSLKNSQPPLIDAPRRLCSLRAQMYVGTICLCINYTFLCRAAAHCSNLRILRSKF